MSKQRCNNHTPKHQYGSVRPPVPQCPLSSYRAEYQANQCPEVAQCHSTKSPAVARRVSTYLLGVLGTCHRLAVVHFRTNTSHRITSTARSRGDKESRANAEGARSRADAIGLTRQANAHAAHAAMLGHESSDKGDDSFSSAKISKCVNKN
jgi:hypothetical protein